MPGVRAAWPEGAFYGFDEIYDIARLDYQGPSFGWWNITDQFALARMDALEIASRSRQPVFVFFPTISTHMDGTSVLTAVTLDVVASAEQAAEWPRHSSNRRRSAASRGWRMSACFPAPRCATSRPVCG